MITVAVMLGCLLFSPYLYAALIIYMMVGMMHEFYAMTMGDIFKSVRIMSGLYAGILSNASIPFDASPTNS